MKIVAVRHGVYYGGALTQFGELQAKRAADVILTHGLVENCQLLNSPSERTAMTAKVIAEELGISAITVHWLELEESYLRLKSGLRDFYSGFTSAGPLILVTHEPVISGIILEFMRTHGDIDQLGSFSRGSIETGSVCLIDLEQSKFNWLTEGLK